MTSRVVSVIFVILAVQYALANEEAHARVRRATPTVSELTDMCGAAGCFRSPTGCNGTECNYAVAFTDNGNNVDFVVAAKINSASYPDGFYVAIGFSEDGVMGSDSVIGCTYSTGGNFIIQASWNLGKSNSPLSDTSLGLSAPEGSYADGYLGCSFSRQKSPSATGADAAKIYDISAGSNYYLLVAVGPLKSNGDLLYHSTKVISPAAIDFTEAVDTGGEEEGISPLLKLHGICMTFAWILFASVGITNARYYKQQWPDKKPGDKALWFWFHQICMSSAVILTIIGFIAIFVEEGDFSSDLLQNASLLLRGHPIIGIIVPILAIINPIMALFRPHPGTSKRPIFNWFHRAVGTVALILGVLNVFIGLQLEHADPLTFSWTTWMLVGWVVFHFIIELTLMCFLRRPTRGGDDAMEMKGPGESSGLSGGGSSMFGTLIMFIYTLVTLIVTLIVIIPMAVGVESLAL